MLARAAASVLIAGALVVGTAGCTFFSQQRTMDPYDPGEGVSATVGEVKVLNALALASEDGDTLSLIMTVANNTETGQTINLQYSVDGEKRTETAFINAGETEDFGYEGADGAQLLVTGAGIEPGGLLPLFVQYGTETGVTAFVPVLDGTLEHFRDLVPENASAD